MNSKGSLKISFDPNGIPFHDLNVLERNSPRKRNLLRSIQNSDFVEHSSSRIKNFPPKKFHSLNLCNNETTREKNPPREITSNSTPKRDIVLQTLTQRRFKHPQTFSIARKILEISSKKKSQTFH